MDLTSRHTGAALPNSAIVGLIRIKGVHKLKREEKKTNAWALGPLCWEIDRAIPLKKPVEGVCGKLGLWSIDKEPSICPGARRRVYSLLKEAKERRGLGVAKPRK
eukprot:TRINITY_DN19976_c0_g1_i2.p2 TRINITY_DN19976_c0_g1~~TRINITY_DN19976_c0_g1_i2.p2  ORF type:complete len:105 (-),score=20.78 TRINITY_DN19976_c0_g1_i2:116-430(-)